MEDFTDQTTVVTGGGGSNIGREVSRLLASKGAEVVIVDKDQEISQETVDIIESDGGNATFVEANLRDVKEISAVIDEVADEFGPIDILVNNAGGASGLRLDQIDEAEFDYNVETNLKSAFFITRAALSQLVANGGGSVVYVSSINALLGGFSEVAYSVSKVGLHALARCLTADYADDGVRFNVVCPGSVIGDSGTWSRREREDPGTKQRLHELYPVGRYGDPEDIAEVISFLSSDRASWISGVVLPVDGGLTATGGLPGGRWWENI
jgi:NAD(P)-dependent dehydrogenase (short-subunit alcohol dehydrogenase family)